MERQYYAAVVAVEEDGRVVQRQGGGLMARRRSDRGMVVRSTTCTLDFLRRIFARLASYFTRVRGLFVFEVGRNGSVAVKEEERGASGNEVEDGLVEASTDLAEIIVTPQKDTTDQDVETCNDDCATKNMDEELHSAPALACMIVEDASEQQQEPQIQPVACESVSVIFPELTQVEDCTVTSEQDEEERCLQIGSQVVDNSRKRPFLERKSSIKELNAVVAEQLSKCLHALERSMVPNMAEHRRAIILATLVAIAVWARNAKHLHQCLPRLTRGTHIDVHFRSRL